MENRTCENKCGMIKNRKTVKQNALNRAFSVFSNYSERNIHASLPHIGDEVDAHQTERLNAERWQHNIAENLRHNTFR